LKYQIQCPHPNKHYYGIHQKRELIRRRIKLLSVPITEIETKRDDMRTKWLQKYRDAANDPWASKTGVIVGAVVGSVAGFSCLVSEGSSHPIIGTSVFFAALLSFECGIHLLNHHFKITEHERKVNALITLIECRQRDEAPDDDVMDMIDE
jgi:hypothetical protein